MGFGHLGNGIDTIQYVCPVAFKVICLGEQTAYSYDGNVRFIEGV